MAQRSKRSNARREPYRIQAARINLELAVELRKPFDARIVEIAKRPLSATDTYNVEAILTQDPALTMGKNTRHRGSRRGTLRIEAARINVKTAVELGRRPDPRVVEIATRRMSDDDTYNVDDVLAKGKGPLKG